MCQPHTKPRLNVDDGGIATENQSEQSYNFSGLEKYVVQTIHTLSRKEDEW